MPLVRALGIFFPSFLPFGLQNILGVISGRWVNFRLASGSFVPYFSIFRDWDISIPQADLSLRIQENEMVFSSEVICLIWKCLSSFWESIVMFFLGEEGGRGIGI